MLDEAHSRSSLPCEDVSPISLRVPLRSHSTPNSPFAPVLHKTVEIRKLKVVGFKGYNKKLQDEYNVQLNKDYQIGSGRFGKVYRGTTVDKSLTLAFKGNFKFTEHRIKIWLLFQNLILMTLNKCILSLCNFKERISLKRTPYPTPYQRKCDEWSVTYESNWSSQYCEASWRDWTWLLHNTCHGIVR